MYLHCMKKNQKCAKYGNAMLGPLLAQSTIFFEQQHSLQT